MESPPLGCISAAEKNIYSATHGPTTNNKSTGGGHSKRIKPEMPVEISASAAEKIRRPDFET